MSKFILTGDLNDSYTLKEPLIIDTSYEDAGWNASPMEMDVTGFGDTEEEAMLDLRLALVDELLFLEAHIVGLGGGLEDELVMLQALIGAK